MRPLTGIFPEIKTPTKPLPINEKVFWSVISLFVFLICSQIPVFGIVTSDNKDPFYWARALLASNKGSLMELGITPIVTASMIMQLLVGARLIDCNLSLRQDRVLFNTAQNVLSVVICFGEALVFILSGAYGEVSLIRSIMIIAQLMMASFIVMQLDLLLSKGYGLGSGISLFITTNVCERIVWSALSPTVIQSERGIEFEGALIAFVHLLLSRRNKFLALKEALYRSSAPNLTNLIATIGILFLVIYFQGFRVELPIKHRSNGGQVGKFPIRLFYTSSTPVIIQTAVVSNIYTVSQLLYKTFKSNPLVNVIGQWQMMPGGLYRPVGGLAYYLSPPLTALDYLTQPIHTIAYVTFVITSCALFSRFYLKIGGNGPREVAKSIRDQGFTLKGIREVSMVEVFENYIPVAASLGGLILGFLTLLADFFGAIGSGTGILLAVTIVFQYYEQFAKEKANLGN